MDETYIKVKGKWTYLYRAVDRDGQTLDFASRTFGSCCPHAVIWPLPGAFSDARSQATASPTGW